MKKGCELCGAAARVVCESDEATLCWDCDARVHGANFLVARHCRTLLCRRCQSPTPWKAEGARLGPAAVSLCGRCSDAGEGRKIQEENRVRSAGGGGAEVAEEDMYDDGGDRDVDDDDDSEDEVEVDDEEEEEVEDEEEGEGDNQVVPLALTPPPEASSSSSEDSSGHGSLKRTRENADLAASQDDRACSSSHRMAPAGPDDEATSYIGDIRPCKGRRRAVHLGGAVQFAAAAHRYQYRAVDLVSE